MKNAMRARGLGLAAVAAVGLAGPALAVPSTQYRGCDGYGAPSDEGDGMTSYANVLGIFNPSGYGTTGLSATFTGQQGVQACTDALTDVPDAHWMRKVSLLRARAIHHLEAGDAKAALADLDLADAAVKDPSDVYYARSLGWGLKIVRAYAMKQDGQKAEAEARAMAALAERPYNRQDIASADMVLQPNGAQADEDEVLRDIARFVPSERARVFLKALLSKDYDAALAIYPHLVPPQDTGGGSVFRGVEEQTGARKLERDTLFHVVIGGYYAYLQAVLGHGDEAEKTLQSLRDALASATTPPPPPFDPNDSGDVARQKYVAAVRIQTAKYGQPMVDSWTMLVENRIKAGQGKVEEVRKAVAAAQLPPGWASGELLQAIAPRSAPKAAARSARHARGTKDAEKSDNGKVLEIDQAVPITQVTDVPRSYVAADLFKVLPEAESARRIPPYEEAKKPWFAFTGSRDDLDTEGWRVREENGATVVGYRGVKSTASIVEEMALLRVAEVAKERGFAGFIITDRKDTEFRIDTRYYGTTLRIDPDGYQCELTVLFVNPGALPGDYKGLDWLVFNAADIAAALAPVYEAPQAQKKE
ncbi:MAG TPA: hypothetical protein VMH86_16285 [Rhizomicrobium sp.]|nr:hypothetical protein [Rhizomicrobium sp.]